MKTRSISARIRMLAVLATAAYALPLFAAWPFDFSAQETALKKYLAALGGHWVLERDADRRIEALTGRAPKLKSLPFPAQVAFLAYGAATLRGRTMADFGSIRTLPPTPGTQRFEYLQCYPQCDDGEIIQNASIVINYHEDSDQFEVLINAVPRGVTLADAAPDEKYAEAKAVEALVRDLNRELVEVHRSDGTRERISRYRHVVELYGDLPSPTAAAEPYTMPLAYRGRLSRVQRVRTKLVVRKGGLETSVAERDYDIDVITKSDDIDVAVVRTIEQLQFVRGRGYVFDPNPRNVLKDKLSDRDVPERFPPYVKVCLPGLAGANRSRFVLQGKLVRIVDRNGSNPGGIINTTSNFSVYSKTEQFAAVMGYYHVDRLQRYFAKRGFGAYQHVPLDVDVEYGTGQDGAYHPNGADGPYISFGFHDAIFIAEDGDVIAHEYGHMLLDRGAGGRYGSGVEARAMREGFSDYLAMSTFVKQTRRNGHDLACFAEWLAHHCLRRLDEKHSYTQLDTSVNASPHENGKIWSAMLYKIFLALGGKRKVVDTLVLTAHINRAGASHEPTMKNIASAMVIAAKKRHKKKLCAIFDDFDLPVAQCAPYAAAP